MPSSAAAGPTTCWGSCAASSRSRPITSGGEPHAAHHASSGNLDARGQGDVDTLTVAEYLKRSRWGRLRYRVYRHPLFMFLPGASFLFFIRHRFTIGLPRAWRRERRSVHATNVAIVAVLALAWCTIGLGTFLMIDVPIVMLGALDRNLDVLHSAPVRRGLLAAERLLGLHTLRSRGKLVLPFAAAVAVVHGQHRLSSHSPPEQPHPQLSLARLLCRRAGLSPGDDLRTPRESQVHRAEALGRKIPADGGLQRGSCHAADVLRRH